MYGYGPQKTKDWVGCANTTTVAGALGVGAQYTMMDISMVHPSSAERFSSGTLEGMRLSVNVDPFVSNMNLPPEVVVMIVKEGETVPTVNTDATLKRAENEVWLVGQMKKTIGQTAGVLRPTFVYEANPKTARKFQKGDRITVVVINRDALVAFNATWYLNYMFEVYCVS